MLDHDLTLKFDELYLVGSFDAEGSRERASGLYLRDTRHLSRFLIRVNGSRALPLMVRMDDPAHATIVSANPSLQLETGETLLPQKISLEERVSLDGSLLVELTMRNFSRHPLELILTIDLSADFRDLFDIRGYPRSNRGELSKPLIGDRSLLLGYRGLDDQIVATEFRFDQEAAFEEAEFDVESGEMVPRHPGVASIEREPAKGVRTSFSIRLAPDECWKLSTEVVPRPAGGPVVPGSGADVLPCGGTVTTDNQHLNRVLRRCRSDLDALQTTFPHGSLPAAGIPWFVAPFGRDSLLVALQTLHLMPERAAGTLRVLAALQGTRIDAVREEEPGKILHEMRYGEMARRGEIPHTPYFGTVDATPLFVWLYAETAIWTGDRALYQELAPNAARALEWIERFGDLDGDGLVEYRSDAAGAGRITNQVWKDSFDSINHANGAPVPGPIAAVEVQGYVYAAYARLADAEDLFGDRDRANDLRGLAEKVRDRVEELFWLDEEGFYAQGLDGNKQQVAALTSNPGHLLMAGLPSPERARSVIERMGRDDFDSGWGIRTLSSGAPSYNPMSYHNGSVWPHDNSLAAAGFFRYGDSPAGNRIFSSLLDVARTDDLQRLPELFCGFPREDVPDDMPVRYPVSCIPQAWAAGSLPLILRAALGLEVDIATGDLLVNPRLPEWVSTVTIDDLAVLGRRGTLTVWRTDDGYHVESDGLPVRIAAHTSDRN